MRQQREKSIQVGHIIRKGGEISDNISGLTDEELKKTLETFEGVKNIDMPLEVRPPQEKDYIDTNRPRPTLMRKVSLEQLLKEEQNKTVPSINYDEKEK